MGPASQERTCGTRDRASGLSNRPSTYSDQIIAWERAVRLKADGLSHKKITHALNTETHAHTSTASTKKLLTEGPQWHTKHKHCTNCARTDRKHAKSGLCTYCENVSGHLGGKPFPIKVKNIVGDMGVSDASRALAANPKSTFSAEDAEGVLSAMMLALPHGAVKSGLDLVEREFERIMASCGRWFRNDFVVCVSDLYAVCRDVHRFRATFGGIEDEGQED